MIDSQLSSSTQRTEALLVHHSNPSLHFQFPETPLSETTPLTIGRQAGVHLLIDEGSISRRHAVIGYINKQYMVQDLGSTNGTFVNNKRVDLAQPCVLQSNDILRFGNLVTCKFLLCPPSLSSQDSTSDNKSSIQWSDESITRLKDIGQEQPILSLDGSLSSPGRE